MSPYFSLFLALPFFIFFFSSATAFNITKILQDEPDFSTFNNYLTENRIADEINSRSTITVLAVANGNMSELMNKDKETVEKIMRIHVLFDYFDPEKLHHLVNQTIMVTTLYQATGLAQNQEGFIHVSTQEKDAVLFGSAVSDSFYGSSLVKSIHSEPYNISVLQVTNLIIPKYETAKPPAKTPTEAPSKSPAKSPTEAPAKSPAESPKKAPSKAPAESPKKAPAKSPTEAPATPSAKSPTISPVKPPAKTPSGAPSPSNAPPGPVSPPDAKAPASSPEPLDVPPAADKSSAGKVQIRLAGFGIMIFFLFGFY